MPSRKPKTKLAGKTLAEGRLHRRERSLTEAELDQAGLAVSEDRLLHPVGKRITKKSPGAAESHQAFLAVKEKATGDPLVEDARRRLK